MSGTSELPEVATRRPSDAEKRAREDKAEIEADAEAAGIPIPAAAEASTSSDPSGSGDAKSEEEEVEAENKTLHHLVHKTVEALYPQKRIGEDYAIPAWKIQQALSALAIGDGMQIPGSGLLRQCGLGEWSGSWLPHPLAIALETFAISITDAIYSILLFYIETLSLTFDLVLVTTSIKYLGAVFGTFAGASQSRTNRSLPCAHCIMI